MIFSTDSHCDKSRFFVQKGPKFLVSNLKIFGSKIIYVKRGFIFCSYFFNILNKKSHNFNFCEILIVLP